MTEVKTTTDNSVSDILEERSIKLPDGLEEAAATRKGQFTPDALPHSFEDSDLVVFIPAYKRHISDSGDALGSFPMLVKDLAEAAERENVNITILISDDTPLHQAALTEASLRVALDGVPSVPDIYLVGRRERSLMFENLQAELEERLSGHLSNQLGEIENDSVDFHQNTLKFLITHHGYGPQRVRAHGMTMGIDQPVMSRDSDLVLLDVEAHTLTNDAWRGSEGFRFVYVNDENEPDIPVAHNPDGRALSHALDLKVGQSLRAVFDAYPETRVYERVSNTKDTGMKEFLGNPDAAAPYTINADGIASGVDLDAVVVSAMDIVWGAPDLNGHTALLNRILVGEQSITSFALPSGNLEPGEGEYPGLLVEQTPNPTCVETRSSREARHMIPWLVTNPRLEGEGGILLQTGARAEDQLLADNDDPKIMMAYSTSMPYHCRAQSGRDDDAVQTFLSEDLGDILAAAVRRRSHFDEGDNRWHFESSELFSDASRRGLSERVIVEEFRGQIEHVWDRVSGIRDLLMREIETDQSKREDLSPLLKDLNQRCSQDYETFENRVLDYLRQQIRFVESVFTVYPVMMEGMQVAREDGRLLALRWDRKGDQI